MAIGRVPGAALLGNLDRQGLDLGFTTNSDTLLQLDFTNFRLGVNTTSPQEALSVTGNVLVTTGNILTSANLSYDVGTATNQWRNIYAGNLYTSNITSTNISGTLTTAAQTNITSLGTLSALTVSGNIIAESSVVPTSNVAGNIGYADKWWSAVYANTINATSLNGTILTAIQPNITNLGNITVDSISIGGNISITGNVTGADIVANNITANTITGTILTSIQPNITNLSNITVDSITVDGNITILGNSNGGIINADELYENNVRVITTATTINVTGDATGSGNVSNLALTLANTGVTAGVYGSADDEYADRIPKITVDSKGRITNIANVTLTQVGNVTFTDTTISTTANLTLAPANNYIFVGNSIISNVANPVGQQDAVTLNYLTSAISAAASSLTNGDSLLSLIDDADSRLELTLDSQLIANITANTSTFYNTVNIGNISINGDTISSPGNIYLNAQNTGIVHIVGTDALSIPAGNSSARPLNPELGYIRFNTDSETLEYWTGTEWTYPGAATITSETITPDGVNASYILSEESTPDALIVSINGTLQQPFTSYTMTGNLITFIETPQDTDIIEIRHIAAGAVSVSSLTYGPTSKVELSTGNINITGNLLPTANVTYDLGSDSLWWRDLYMSGSTIHIGGALLKVVDNALSFTPAGSATPINLSNDINPSLLYAGNSNVTVTNNFVNVAVNSSNIASFSSLGLAATGNISAANFNYTNGVSILDSVTSSLATLTSNAAVQSGLITDTNTAITTANTNLKGYTDNLVTTANTNLKGYVDAANTIQSNQISGANSAITIANTNMKGYVDGQITSLINGAPGTLDTLNEIANALGTDANLSVTLTSLIANVQSNVTTANTAMKGYVDAQDTIITNSVTGANAAIVTANTALKGYVDAANTIQSNQITAVTSSVTGANAAIVTANTNMKGYVDGQISTTTSAITTANTNMKGYVDAANTIQSGQISTTTSAITTANTNMKGYVDAVTTAWTANAGAQAGSISALETSKANISGAAFTGNISTTGNLNVTGNIGASSLNLSSNITFSSTNVPHRIRGDFSTSYTSVSEQNKVFFQSTGATDDTYIRVLGGTTSGIGGVKLYGTYDPDNSTILQLDSVPGLQSRIVSYASGTATAVPLRISAGSTDVVIGTSGIVEVSGRITTTDLTVTNTISGTANNALNLGGTAAASYAQTSTVIGVNQTWQNVSASRAASTTYTNSTGKPIFISVRWDRDDGTLELTVDGLLIGRTGQTAGPVSYTLTAIVPAGSTYMAATTGSGGTLYWHELR